MDRRSDGLWRERISVDGKTTYFYGKTKADVARKIRDWRTKEKAGKTFPAVADMWWKKHEPTLAPNTLKGYLPAIKRAKDRLKCDIADLRPVDISRALDHLIEDNDMAEKTAKTQLLVINLICRFAVTEGLIDTNPCAEIRVPKGLKHGRRKAATREEVEIIKKNADEPFGLFALLILCTGLRRGEVLALRWADVDLKKREIRVSASLYYVNGHPEFKIPKTEESARIVPILDALLPHLHPGAPTEYLFGGQKPLTQWQMEKAWEEYAAAAGISCTPHQIRHAYATALWEAGVDELLASKLLGHAQISTTKDIYTHVREDFAKQERRKINDKKVV